MRAHTRPLVVDVDLNDVAGGEGFLFVRDGVGIAGRDVAARISPRDVPAALAAIEHVDEVGDIHPLAIGSIPFEPDTPCELIIPRVVVGKAADGRRWVTVIDDASFDITPAPRPQPRAQAFNVAPLTEVDHYLAAVTTARDAVRDGVLTKAVIAREIVVTSPEPIDVHAVLRVAESRVGRREQERAVQG